ncbi:MAG: type II secretion system protein [Limosilactobacillus sp.]|uniref:type II secretion system protein n=1 Tax=Limosilactobacillus sp. TaxID=2773925 RepID=UPI002706D070|nr:type II secretion system protein [Limosilactobacillus sp.]
MAEERFFQSFRQEWQSAQVRSRVQGKYTAIKYSESNHAVSFAYGHNLCDWVNLPNSLQVKNFPNKMVMENNGYVKPTTITLYSTVEHCEYQIVVQMARGEYDVKKSTRVRDGG